MKGRRNGYDSTDSQARHHSPGSGRKQLVNAVRRKTGAKAFLRRVMLDGKPWPSISHFSSQFSALILLLTSHFFPVSGPRGAIAPADPRVGRNSHRCAQSLQAQQRDSHMSVARRVRDGGTHQQVHAPGFPLLQGNAT